MNLPGDLRTEAFETFALPSGRAAEIQVARPVFAIWNGPPVDTYGGKRILNYRSEAVYAELAELRLLQNAGWDGFWADSYRKRYRRAIAPSSAAHSDLSKQAVMESLPGKRHPNAFKKFGGAWDVVAWRGDSIIFCECKLTQKDKIRETQLRWLEERLNEGADLDQFRIIEWTASALAPKSSIQHLGWLENGQWFAWQMLPGYAGTPYFSPIFINRCERSGSCLRLNFYNAAYAEGLRDFDEELIILHTSNDHLVAKLTSEPSRSVVISKLTATWLELILPAAFRDAHPLPARQTDLEHLQTYLNRLKDDGRL